MGRILYPLAGAVVGFLLAVLVVMLVFEHIVGAHGFGLLGAALVTYIVFGPAGAVGGVVVGYRLWSRRHTARLLRDMDRDA